MSSKKRMAAVAITVATLTAGSIGVASAHDGAGKGAAKATALADLVKAGTITQAQADAITRSLMISRQRWMQISQLIRRHMKHIAQK